MKITLLVVGKVKESYLRQGIEDYMKRLKPYVDLTIIEVADERAPEELSDREREPYLKAEGERLLAKLPSGKTYVLAIEGKAYSSMGLAELLRQDGIYGESRLNFIIGGSLGLWDGVYQRAQGSISFSKLTFPHQLMRLIFFEQLYRTQRIIHHHPYHK